MTNISRTCWRKSRFSQSGGNCVEVAFLNDDQTAVRDSKDPNGPILSFATVEWQAFIVGAKGIEFDVLS